MNVYKRGDSPFWWAKLTIEGKVHQFSTKRTKKAEALVVAAAERTRLLDRVQLGVADSKTLGQMADEWLAVEGLRQSAGENNRFRIGKLFGHSAHGVARAGLPREVALDRITTSMLASLCDARRAEGNSEGTIGNEMNLVRSIMRYAKDRGIAVPVIEWGALATVKRGGKLRWLTLEEEARLLDRLERDVRDGRAGAQDQLDLTMLLLDTGARYMEAAALSWDAVDLAQGTVTLYRTKVENEGRLSLASRSRAMLTRRHGERTLACPYVFPGKDGKGHREYAVRGIRAAMDAVGLNAPHLVARFGSCTIHTLRHTFASRLVQAGVPLIEVQKMLGHASITQTEVYAKLAPGYGSSAARVLDQLHAPAGVPDNVVTLGR